MNDSPMQSLAQFQSNTSNMAQSANTASITSSGSSSSIYMSSILSTVSLAFTSGGHNTSQSNQPPASTITPNNTSQSSSLSMLTQMQAAQINELNAIMACVAMFANSMVSKEDTAGDQSNDYQSSLSSSIIDSIMVLLEPLMLCSGGVTYTMRYFLNEISLHIPELKLSIHENLLKILSQILTGKPLYQIIQAISVSASHLIRSNNLYSLMSNSGVSASPFDFQNVR